MKDKIKVGLIFGGRSGEHEVSLASAISVYNALDKARYDITLIGITKDGRWVLPDAKSLLSQADNPMLINLARMGGSQSPSPIEHGLPAADRLDVVFPVLHGTYGEDGTIQGLLELAQIPYVGSGVLGSAIGMDKDVTARLLAAAGIATVPSLCVHKRTYAEEPASVHEQILKKFKVPFFVKPANAGSSVGVHKVKSADALANALADAFDFDLKVLVQEAVAARELEVAVLGNESPRASIVGEIIPRHEFYSYEAKYIDAKGADLAVPAREVPADVAEKARAWAVAAFQTLECRGLARVDFFLDKQTGRLYLNEINTIPGFTKISMYPKLWEASGLKYPQLLDELIRLAIDHHGQRRALKTSYNIKERAPGSK